MLQVESIEWFRDSLVALVFTGVGQPLLDRRNESLESLLAMVGGCSMGSLIEVVLGAMQDESMGGWFGESLVAENVARAPLEMWDCSTDA